MDVFIAIVVCMLNQPHDSVHCQDVVPPKENGAPGEPASVSGMGMCLKEGEKYAAKWIEDHPKWVFDHVRCRPGTPFVNRDEI